MPVSHSKPFPIFPFTAVIGQTALKTALLLSVIEPRLGGVLLCGPRGIAKTTLARSLTTLLPHQDGNFVELPLGCSPAHLTGSIDIEQALTAQSVTFRPGLLAKAHRGILYVDEVNLLPDILVDLLLDAAASGRHRVERDGISQNHPSEFVLMGSMNPDEGELRPQLCDRFGLAVFLNNDIACDERVAIVRARRRFDADPQGFCQQHATAMLALAQQLNDARAQLPSVTLPESLEYHIAMRCVEAGVEGVRADIAWQRAASAYAALRHRTVVTLDDVNHVEALVLNHRRPHTPPSQPSPPSPSCMPPAPFASGSPSVERSSQHTCDSNSHSASDISFLDCLGDSTPPTEHGTPLPCTAEDNTRHFSRATSSTPSFVAISAQKRSASASHHSATRQCTAQGAHHTDEIDWERTFSQADNLTSQGLTALLPQTARPSVHDAVLLMIDASASQRHPDAFTQTKYLAQQLIAQAQRAKRYVALLYFQGHNATWVLRGKERIRNVTRALAALQPSGGTPLNLALQEGRRWVNRWTRQFPNAQIDSWLITDGRCTWESMEKWPCTLTVIDNETADRPLQRCRTLAEALGGHYVTAASLRQTSAIA